MASLFNRDRDGRTPSLMSKYEKVRAFYSHVGMYKNSGYDNSSPLYVSIFSYIQDGNSEKANKTEGVSAKQYYIYNQGLSLADINVPKDARKKVKSASEFKGLLDKEVQNYLKQIGGKYANMSDGQLFKIVEQRFKDSQEKLGVLKVDPDEDFNKKFIQAVFTNSKGLTKNKNRELIIKTFDELQVYINTRLEDKTASLQAARRSSHSKKDLYVLGLDKNLKALNEQFYTLLWKLKNLIEKSFVEGDLDKEAFDSLQTFQKNISNKLLVYQSKTGKIPNPKFQTYFDSSGIQRTMKSLVSEGDTKQIDMMERIVGALGKTAGLMYEVNILASAIALMIKGRDEIGNFKSVSKEEIKAQALLILKDTSKKSKNFTVEGRTFSGQITGDLRVGGKISKADVMLRMENTLKKSTKNFNISAKKHDKSKFRVHKGSVDGFANGIKAKGRNKEALIAQSMADTISWYPTYFKKGRQNNSIFEMFRKMVILNLDYFYGFNVNQLFSTRSSAPDNLADAIRKTSIRQIKLDKDKIAIALSIKEE